MPIGELHKKKRTKNYVVLALIFGWCALIWITAMVRMAHSADLDSVFIEDRKFHQQQVDEAFESWQGNWQIREEEAQKEQTEKKEKHASDQEEDEAPTVMESLPSLEGDKDSE